MQDQLDAIAKILGKKKGVKNHDGRKNPKAIERHIWSIQDEELAIALYKRNATPTEIATAIEDTGIKPSSMLMKLSNLRYLDKGDGLKNVSETTKTLWEKLK